MAALVLGVLLLGVSEISAPPCTDALAMNLTIGVLRGAANGSVSTLAETFNSWFPGSRVSVISKMAPEDDGSALIGAVYSTVPEPSSEKVLELLSLNVQAFLVVMMSCQRSRDLISFLTDLNLDLQPLMASRCQNETDSVAMETWPGYRTRTRLYDVLMDVVTWERAAYVRMTEMTVIYDDSFRKAEVMQLAERLSNMTGGLLVAVHTGLVGKKKNRGAGDVRRALRYATDMRSSPRTFLLILCSDDNTRYILQLAGSVGLSSRFHFWVLVNADLTHLSGVLRGWPEGNLLLVKPVQKRPPRCFMSHVTERLQERPLVRMIHKMVGTLLVKGGTTDTNNEDTKDCSSGRMKSQMKSVPEYKILSLSPATDAPSATNNSKLQDGGHVHTVEQATWRHADGLRLSGQSLFLHPPDNLEGRVFIVGVPGDYPPYIEVDDTRDCCTRVFRPDEAWPFSGFCLDLFREHARRLNFTVKFFLLPPGLGTGSPDGNGSWSGLLGMVIRQELDILVGPITRTPERALHLAFTGPFIPDQIGIMMLKGQVYDLVSTRVFATFSFQVWSAIFGGVGLVGSLLFIVYRSEIFINQLGAVQMSSAPNKSAGKPEPQLPLSMDDKIDGTPEEEAQVKISVDNPATKIVFKRSLLSIISDGRYTEKKDVGESVNSPAVKDKDSAGELRTFLRSLWGAFGLYLEQGMDVYPGSVSGRLAVAIWWLFAIVISATYTANLTAHLSVSSGRPPINNIEDLANPRNPLFPLILRDTNLRELFKFAEPSTVYGRVWKRLEQVMATIELPNDLDEAFSLLSTGKYALLQEEDMLRYRIAQDCGTFILAEHGFHPTMMGFAMNLASPYTTVFDMVGVKLQESGIVDKYKQQWWPSKTYCEEGAGSQPDVHRLGLSQMAGAFLVVINALLASLAILVCEISWERYAKRDLRSKSGRKTWKMTELNGDERRWSQIL